MKEIINDYNLSEDEAEEVRDLMDEEGLDEDGAMEILDL